MSTTWQGKGLDRRDQRRQGQGPTRDRFSEPLSSARTWWLRVMMALVADMMGFATRCEAIGTVIDEVLRRGSRHISRCWLGLVIAALMMAQAASAPDAHGNGASGFEVQGTIEMQRVLRLSQGNQPSTRVSFTARVFGNKWFIRAEQRYQRSPVSTCTEAGTDGDGVCWVSYTSASNSPTWSAVAACATSEPVPCVLDNPAIQVVWLAFASAEYFRQLGSDHAKPLFFTRGPQTRNVPSLAPVRFAADLQPAHLLLEAAYFDDGVVRSWDDPVEVHTTPPHQRRRAPPYADGFTNIAYVVTAHTNFGGIRVPSAFELRLYKPKTKASSSGDLDIVSLCVGAVSNAFQVTAPTSFRPSLPPGVPLMDERFAGEGSPLAPLLYPSTNRWLTLGEVRQRPEFLRFAGQKVTLDPKKLVKSGTKPGRPSTVVRALVWAGMFAGLAAIVVFRLKANAKPSTKDQHDN